MKIGVISDTHIPDDTQELPQVLINGLKDVDMIIHAGDLVNMKVLEKLKSICPNVIAVYGNMDPSSVRQKLPEKKIINAGKFKIGIMHGWGAPHNLADLILEEFRHENVDMIIFGHSHNCVNEQKNGILLFNPGSATDKIFAEYNSYGLIEINDGIKTKIIKI